MPFSSRLPRSKPHARGASTPTNPRLCDRTSSDNESQALPKRQSQDVADISGNMKLRYAAMMYTRANTLARQVLDRQENQVVGQPVVEAALAKTSSSRQSSQNMPTLEHAMDLEDSLASLPFRRRTVHPTVAKMSGHREQATTRRGRLGFHTSRTAQAMRHQNSPGAEGCFLLKKESKQARWLLHMGCVRTCTHILY